MRRPDRPTRKLTLSKENLRNIVPSQLAVVRGGSAYPAVEYDVAPPRDTLA